MNSYGSLKQFEPQILGRKIQEPNISVTNKRNLKSPRVQSPEQNLDQIANNKPQQIPQTQKKKKVLQGSQGKSKSQMNTAKKSFYPSKEKQQKKLLQQQTKKKSNTVSVSNTISPSKNLNSKKQIKGQNICEMIIKQQIKKQNLQKEQKQSSEKKIEQQPEKKNQRSKEEIQLYMNCKRAQDTINLKNQQIQFLLEQQRKMENLMRLDNERKLQFHKSKTIDQKATSPKKGKKKSKKAKQKTKLKIAELLGQKIKQEQNHQVLRKNQSQKEFAPKMEQYQISERKMNVPDTEQIPSHRSEFNLPKEVEDLFYMYPPSMYLQQIVYNLIAASEDLSNINLTEGDILLLQYHYLQALAIKIQSVWKGHFTRKNFYSQFSQGYSVQQSNKNNEENFEFQEESSESNMQVVNPPQSQNSQQEDEYDQFKKDKLNIMKVLGKLKNWDQKSDSNILKNEEECISDQSDDLVILDSKNLKEDQNISYNQNLEKMERSESQQESMIQEIENQLQDWNFNIEALLKDNRKSQAIKSLKQQMQQAIVSIVQTQLQKIKYNQSQERKDSDQSINLALRLSQETNNEKVFNDARKKFKTVQEQSEERLLLSSKDQFTDINRSSLLALQSQLMKKEIELLSMREEAIQIRYQAEIKKNANNESKKAELQAWLQKELEDLLQTKQAIEFSTKKEASAMKKIQRDLIIAQSFDENNSKLQSLKKKVDEQLSNMKQSKQSQSDLKFINNNYIQNENELEKLAETQSEDFEQENQIIQRQVFNENVIEPEDQIDQQTKINIVTNEVFDEILDELAEEILTQQQEFDIIISTMLRLSIPPSIPTSIVEIRYYLHNLFDFILPRHYYEILRNANTPYLFSPFKRLQLIHGYNIYDQQDSDQVSPFVLKDEYFLEFEQYRLQEVESQNEDSVTQAMRELEHVHNRAIFDACNEALNQFRPFFKNGGAPYPWEGSGPLVQINDVELSEILKNMELKIVQWAGCLCGFLPIEENLPVPREKQVILEEKNQQLMIQQMQYQENPDLYDPEYLNYYDPILQIREQRQYKMLIADNKEKEFKWTQDQDDRAELLMEISDNIFEFCIEDFLKEVIIQ